MRSGINILTVQRHILFGLSVLFSMPLSLDMAQGTEDGTIWIDARIREKCPDDGEAYRMINKRMPWHASETAVIICDMWDRHWCKGATERVAELAPRINRFVDAARRNGVLIVHAPSDVVDYYKNHPGRRMAQSAARAAELPDGIDRWCRAISAEESASWPIDQSDEGCDCEPRCKTGRPWTRQIDTIETHEGDAISDSGAEIWNLFESRGIRNVIVVGVHTNMCVVGRPFGLRNMARFGKNVVLCRDLTDTMYNHRMPPHVSHFAGTDLIVEHIEKYICPTVLSTCMTGQPPFRFQQDKRSRIVFISAEFEYDANRSLAEWAHDLLLNHGFNYEFLQGSTDRRGIERNHIPDMAALNGADLAVLFVRRRALPPAQMNHLRAYLEAGKPMIALRTASHAFALRDQVPEGLEHWPEFDREVLGCRYQSYPHGETLAYIVPEASEHPILKGLQGPYQVRETMYRSQPLAATCTVLMMGKCVDGGTDDERYHKDPEQNIPDEPVVWVNDYKGARIFYTCMGNGRAAFEQDWFKNMITNAVYWALENPMPEK